MLSISYLFELTTNQGVYAQSELNKRLKKEKNPKRTEKLLNAKSRLDNTMLATAWNKDPTFMKSERTGTPAQKEAARIRGAVFEPITKPDLRADIARKTKVTKRMINSTLGKIKRAIQVPAKPVPTLVGLAKAPIPMRKPAYAKASRPYANVPLRRAA